MKNIVKKIFHEFYLLYFNFINKYPDSIIGYKLRKNYWSRNLNNCGKNPKISMQGTIGFPELIDIGDNFILGNYAHITAASSKGIFIGSNVSISRGSYLHASNHNIDNENLNIMDQGTYTSEIEYKNRVYSVIIEDNVWIGSNVVILSGTFLESGCVVASGSIVSGRFKKDSVIGGNPSRFIKKRFQK